MEDNVDVSELTSGSKINLRGTLEEVFDAKEDPVVSAAPEHNNPEVDEESEELEESEEVQNENESKESKEVDSSPEQKVALAQERIPLVPPADMNKLEKEAYLNPTPANAHILQQYMNRRAYETRTDYQRKMQEVEQLRAQTSGIYDTIKQYENDYAKQGISLGDIAKRSIAWDKAMQANPVQTAREWLESYGVNLQDLVNGNEQRGEQQVPTQQYLTREEAERIADEKFQAIQDQQQQKAVAYYNERAVESFIAAKPLFKDPETASQLEAEMAPIVQALTGTGRYSSPEEILETAYNYVVAGNPTFSSLNSAMTARTGIEKRQAEVQKAKAVSRSVSGSASSGTPRLNIKDIGDNLRRRMGE